MTEDELLEMASLSDKTTGIQNVVIWVGPNSESNQYRIYVNNQPNRYDATDYFTMSIPDFKVSGHVNSDFITLEIIEKIKDWCNLNMEAIFDYSDYRTSTDQLLEQLKPVNN